MKYITWRNIKNELDNVPDTALDSDIFLEEGFGNDTEFYRVIRIISFDDCRGLSVEIERLKEESWTD
jgi:hypothetical protein